MGKPIRARPQGEHEGRQTGKRARASAKRGARNVRGGTTARPTPGVQQARARASQGIASRFSSAHAPSKTRLSLAHLRALPGIFPTQTREIFARILRNNSNAPGFFPRKFGGILFANCANFLIRELRQFSSSEFFPRQDELCAHFQAQPLRI